MVGSAVYPTGVEADISVVVIGRVASLFLTGRDYPAFRGYTLSPRSHLGGAFFTAYSVSLRCRRALMAGDPFIIYFSYLVCDPATRRRQFKKAFAQKA